MAIAAIDADSADVVRVAEGNGLFPRLGLSRHVGRAGELENDPSQKADDEDGAEYRNARERISAVMEDLGHDVTVPILKQQIVQ
jgi:hypothetical protein